MAAIAQKHVILVTPVGVSAPTPYELLQLNTNSGMACDYTNVGGRLMPCLLEPDCCGLLGKDRAHYLADLAESIEPYDVYVRRRLAGPQCEDDQITTFLEVKAARISDVNCLTGWIRHFGVGLRDDWSRLADVEGVLLDLSKLVVFAMIADDELWEAEVDSRHGLCLILRGTPTLPDLGQIGSALES